MRLQHGGRQPPVRRKRIDTAQRQQRLGTKVELKNMNTFRGVEKALEYEVLRQKEVIETGGKIVQQTFYGCAERRTVPMRSKEDAHDYRYFPEPDLPALIVEDERIETLRRACPNFRMKNASGLCPRTGSRRIWRRYSPQAGPWLIIMNKPCNSAMTRNLRQTG